MFRKKTLPVNRMIELEKWINTLPPQIQSHLGDSELPQMLSLKMEYVNKLQLPPDAEAELCPSTDEAYNGLIRIDEKLKNTSFPYMHEIIHYLRDVGIGNRVTRCFQRKTTGKTEDISEQDTNYCAAASVMRYSEIKDLLIEYDKTHPKMDELAFVDSICKKYKQDRVAVMRRIVEVRQLRAFRTRK